MTYSGFAKMLPEAVGLALFLSSMHVQAQNVTGSGTPGKVALFTDVTAVGDSAISQRVLGCLRSVGCATLVGIGTDNPQFGLDVSSGNGIKLGLEGSGGGQLHLRNNLGDNSIYFEGFSTDATDSAGSMLFTGRLGQPIPSLQFSATHHLFWTGNSGQVRIEDLSNQNYVNIRPNSGNAGWLSLTEDSVADRWIMGIRPADDHLYFAIGNPVLNANRITFSSNGDIVTSGAVAANQGLIVNGQQIVDATGHWRGQSSGIQGPPGPTGPAGPAGPQGPIGSPNHSISVCYTQQTACNLACSGRVVQQSGYGSGNCSIRSDSGQCSVFVGIGWCCACGPN